MCLDSWDLDSNAHDNAVDVLEKEDGGIVYHAHRARKLLILFRKSRFLLSSYVLFSNFKYVSNT